EIYRLFIDDDDLLKLNRRVDLKIPYSELQENRFSFLKLCEKIFEGLMKRDLFDKFVKHIIVDIHFNRKIDGYREDRYPENVISMVMNLMKTGFANVITHELDPNDTNLPFPIKTEMDVMIQRLKKRIGPNPDSIRSE